MFYTAQDYYKAFQDSFAAFPKTFDEVKATAEKVKKVVESETENTKDFISVYNKASRGDASMNEIMQANKKFQRFLVASRFAAVMAVPGSIFALPILSKVAEEYDVEFVPESVKSEFGI